MKLTYLKLTNLLLPAIISCAGNVKSTRVTKLGETASTLFDYKNCTCKSEEFLHDYGKRIIPTTRIYCQNMKRNLKTRTLQYPYEADIDSELEIAMYNYCTK